MAIERKKTGEQVIPVKVAGSSEEARNDAEAEAQVETADDALEVQLEAAQAQAEEYLDQLQRTAAQFSNYKKRIEREQAQFTQLANAALITRLLPIADDFERAFETMPPNLSKVTWLDGLLLIYRKLQQVLEQEEVEAIETQGEVFDPLLHQAVTYEEAEGFEEGQIIAEVQKGYRLGERVLRPSMVRVAR